MHVQEVSHDGDDDDDEDNVREKERFSVSFFSFDGIMVEFRRSVSLCYAGIVCYFRWEILLDLLDDFDNGFYVRQKEDRDYIYIGIIVAWFYRVNLGVLQRL